MKFTVAGSRIICSRRDSTSRADDPYRRVVELDANLDRIPRQVASRLTRGEIEELARFMADRHRIRANPAGKKMLEELPGLLEEATGILESVDQVNDAMYDKVTASLAELCTALDKVKPVDDGRLTLVRSLAGTEAQEERLEYVKPGISKR